MADPTQRATNVAYARLVYLIIRHKIPLTPLLASFIPAGTLLATLATNPIPFSNSANIESLFDQGSKYGPGSIVEAVGLIRSYVEQSLSDSENATDLKLMKTLTDQLQSLSTESQQIQFYQLDLSEPGEAVTIPRFDSGFNAFDEVLGGWYQGIFTLMAHPAVGKTSVCLTLLENMVKTGAAESTLFVENEIPGPIMRGRMQPILSRTQFRKGKDFLICASWGTGQILDWVEKHPDQNRVIFFDSPDQGVLSFNGESGPRIAVANAWGDLIKIKQLSKAVIVTTWPRRKQGALTLTDPSEGASKERNSDALIALEETSRYGVLSLRALKNRFGTQNVQTMFSYDYAQMSWSTKESADVDSESDSSDGW